MKSIVFASSNKDKITEVSQILLPIGIHVDPLNADLKEIRSESQEEIAIEKARTAYSIAGKPVIAEDTGVYFEAYGNFPGVFPSFLFKEIGYAGLLKLLEGKSRSAHFKTIVAYFDGRIPRTFEGVCKGKITQKPDLPKFRNPKLPYEAIFIPDGFDVRICRMSKEKKNTFSHRSIAARKFGDWYLKQ